MNDDQRRDHDGSATEPWSRNGSTAEPGSTVLAPSFVDAPAGQGGKLGAERALLVGLLALQNGFIDSATLVDAVHAWIADKSRPMGAILLGWGQVDGEQLAALEQLATLAIKRDGGDVSRCLSSLGSTPSLLHLLGSADNEVRTLLIVAGDLARARAQTQGDRSGSRYRIVRKHAEGGLGEVYLAEDIEVGRKVALKEIQPKYSGHHQYRARFLLEAEVTAGLEHPGIVPIHGMGRYADGRPYYAMRFIKGDSLKKSIADFRADPDLAANPRERTLALRALLRRFLSVCDAIEYAHSRRVLHRDIKPANIMLGKFGETLVVDWGVAKLLDKSDPDQEIEGDEGPLHPSATSEVEPTRMESACGSPPYMSPEQAAGRVDLVNIPSDVYGLGSTLYHLLTGVAPFPEAHLSRIKPSILAGQFPRPREVDATISPALEAISLKAMALDPVGRYASARDLAADIERWLDDEPVSAHAEPIAARAGRWARRHKPLVVGIAATVVVALVALAVNGYLVGLERDKVVAANQRDIQTTAIMGETLGESTQTLAMLMTTLSSDLFAGSPNLQEIRLALADRTSRIAQAFLRQRPSDGYIQQITAPILHRAGVIHRQFGKFQVAIGEFRQADSLYQERERTDPKHRINHMEARAEIAIEMGEAFRLSGDGSRAIQSYGQSRILAERLRDEYPEDPKQTFVLALARARYHVAGQLQSEGHYAEAEGPNDEAIALLERPSDRSPFDRFRRQLLMLPLINRAVIFRETGRLAEADGAITAGFTNLVVLESQAPRTNQTEFNRFCLLDERAKLLAKTGASPAEVDQVFADLQIIIDRLADQFPAFTPYLIAQVDRLIDHATFRAEAGPAYRSGAEADARLALKLIARFPDKQVSPGGIRRRRGKALGILGRLEPDPTEAARLLGEAIKDQEAALADSSDNLVDQKALKAHQDALDRLRSFR